MATAVLNAELREGRHKGPARRLRAKGSIPAILYGKGEDSISLMVKEKDIDHLLHTVSIENTIVDLTILGNGGKTIKTLIREVQQHPFKSKTLHVDFLHISMEQKISLEVPVVLVGAAVGVKMESGILEHMLRDLEVYCYPADIPERIEVDISNLHIGDSIHVSDLRIENVEILTDLGRSIATVVPPIVVVEPVVEVAEEVAEPELVGKEKEEKVEDGKIVEPKEKSE